LRTWVWKLGLLSGYFLEGLFMRTPAGTEQPGSRSNSRKAERTAQRDRSPRWKRTGTGRSATGHAAPGARVHPSVTDDEVGARCVRWPPQLAAGGSELPRCSRSGSSGDRGSPGRGVVQRQRMSGDRRDRAVRGTARRAFGHDGRCEQVEREANASRSICGGSSQPG
jgi:hypothetical protein